MKMLPLGEYRPGNGIAEFESSFSQTHRAFPIPHEPGGWDFGARRFVGASVSP